MTGSYSGDLELDYYKLVYVVEEGVISEFFSSLMAIKEERDSGSQKEY